MFPNILGFENSSYILFLVLGVFFAILIAVLFFVKNKITRSAIVDLIICSCFAISFGIVFAILFENLYEFPLTKKWTWAMTFFGGLFGGVIGFIGSYYLFMRKTTELSLKNVLIIAPGAISIGHAFGRIGCFLAGCCYGKPSQAWYALECAHGLEGKFIPTQLFESLFLFLLAAVLIILAFTINFKYTFTIYMVCYGLFRFFIEFLRDDNRGAFLFNVLSPSQIWSIVLLILAVPFYFLLRKIIFAKKVNYE